MLKKIRDWFQKTFGAEELILLDHPDDIAFTRMAHKATVTDTTFPSGLKTPPGKTFLVRDGYLERIS